MTKITNGPGIPVTPPVDVDDPDDDEVSYLECEISILAWALRDQDIEW